MNKLIPIILFYLQDGSKPRHKVTAKIKNYPKPEREEAIEYVVNEKLVSLSLEASCVGRTPVSISLTEKGAERAKELSTKSRHKSVWGV